LQYQSGSDARVTARGAQVAEFARRHGLLCTTLQAVREYRLA